MDLTFPWMERKRMTSPHLIVQQVRAYWQGLRGADGTLPDRARLDPRGLSGTLEQVFLAERVAPGLARFRLAGSHLTDLLGIEVQGMPLFSLLAPDARPRLAAAMEQVFTTPATADLWLEAERGIGKPALTGRMILLPLHDLRGEVSLVLGCLATEGNLGRAPRRFAIGGLAVDPLTTATPQPAFREAPAAYLPPPRAKPALRLVYSRD